MEVQAICKWHPLDWEQLGRGLGVYVESLYSNSNKENSLNLKECLSEWLGPGTSSFFFGTRNDPPTLYGLAAALDSIGYSEAGEYIIKTGELIIMFNDQCY